MTHFFNLHQLYVSVNLKVVQKAKVISWKRVHFFNERNWKLSVWIML